MLQIDHVRTDVEVVADSARSEGAGVPAGVDAIVSLIERDPVARRQLRELMLDLLRDELRELERQGHA